MDKLTRELTDGENKVRAANEEARELKSQIKQLQQMKESQYKV